MPDQEILRYADDLTEDDVRALFGFVLTQLKQMTRHHASESDELRAARGLANVMSDLVYALYHDLREKSAGHDESAHIALTRRRRIQANWNLPWRASWGWHQSNGYNAARWRYLQQLDTADRGDPRQSAIERLTDPY